MPLNPSTTDATARDKLSWRTVLGWLAFAALVRGGVLLAQAENLRDDPDAYAVIAENLARDGVYSRRKTNRRSTDRSAALELGQRVEILPPTAYRPPLYPVLLSNLAPGGQLSLVGVAVLHFVLGIATVLLTLRLAQLWGLGRWSQAAALLAACDPILLQQSTLVMTETLATFLAVVGLYALTRFSAAPNPFNAALVGGGLALAALCRPTFLPWLAFVVVALPLVGGGWMRRMQNAAALVVVAGALLAPWTIRNFLLSGKPIFATTHGGYTLLLGNNPWFYKYLREGEWGKTFDAESYDLRMEADVAGSTLNSGPAQPGVAQEVREDKLYYEHALRHIRREPGMFAYSCLVRVGRLWGLVPHQLGDDESLARRLLRYAVGAWYAVVFVLAIIAVVRLRGRLWRAPWLWGVLLCLAFTAMHAVYWSNLRMRAPLMPVVALAAAVGASAVADGVVRRRAKSS